MKAKVIITPKPGARSAGQDGETALEHMGCTGVGEVRVGEHEIEMVATQTW